jgi:Ni/Co efflux regulator RcnB
MNICAANHALSVEVLKFLENVGDVKEESITDYLVWKWRELDRRFNFVRVTPFNHHEENTHTGADFDLELWFVGSNFNVSLAVQSKKVVKQHDSYVRGLRYPKGTKTQMKTLLDYAKRNSRLPCYFLYTIPEATTFPMCMLKHCFSPHLGNGAVFIADALVMEEYADGKHGRSVSRDQLIGNSIPFHCMFCCPCAGNAGWFQRYFPRAARLAGDKAATLPSYARRLLAATREPNQQSVTLEPAEREAVRHFRIVGVYDMRRDA